MAVTHNLGFPRIGPMRELKFACEAYWSGDSNADTLTNQARALRDADTLLQANGGLDWVPSGDFSLYDHVLDTSLLFGNIPSRFQEQGNNNALDLYFRMARGRSQTGSPTFACEMTKWFDTNYHYLVPEFEEGREFRLNAADYLNKIRAARALEKPGSCQIKPVLLGPLTYLWLGKSKTSGLDRLGLLDQLLPLYRDLLAQLRELGVEWVQIDEPILVLDLPDAWQARFEPTYHKLQIPGIKLLMATYFGTLGNHLNLVANLPVAGVHLDAVRGRADVARLLDVLPAHKVLSLGVIDGRNIWKTDLESTLDWLEPIHTHFGDRLWLAPSCSLLHVPVDLAVEDQLDPELKSWLAFATQKLGELNTLKIALNKGRAAVGITLKTNRDACASRRKSTRVHNPEVASRTAGITPDICQRVQSYCERAPLQRERWQLPLFPTTTIGSFPQTAEIRRARQSWRHGTLDPASYQQEIREQIRHAVQTQEDLGLDVLVHGEAERNDMVEYFGEELQGYAFTRFGWVQSYGSRCVKPPIIYGDVSRPRAITVEWTCFAQSLTDKPMKGMLTGPVTMLQWAFVRDDQPRRDTALQIALALRDEVADLERSGIGIIQVDEPAFREGLPLRQSQWAEYLTWAAQAFRLSTSSVTAETQIHTHMCYSEFNDIIDAIAALDADVITIETSRSNMELLDAFVDFAYPNEVGPGVYDIHSPNLPSREQMTRLLRKAALNIPPERLWVNPDCGLKTRRWKEVLPALQAMVEAARELRNEHIRAAATA